MLVEALASGTGRRILFMRTKHHAKKLARQLTDAGIPAVDLHGNLSQVQRDRNLAAFSAPARCACSSRPMSPPAAFTSMTSSSSIHVDPPAEHKAYLHRSGRTARAGAEGDVVTLVLPEQRKDTAPCLRKAGIRCRPAAGRCVVVRRHRSRRRCRRVREAVAPRGRSRARPVAGRSLAGRERPAQARQPRWGRTAGGERGEPRWPAPAQRNDRRARPGQRSGGQRTGSSQGGAPHGWLRSNGGSSLGRRRSGGAGSPGTQGRRTRRHEPVEQRSPSRSLKLPHSPRLRS